MKHAFTCIKRRTTRVSARSKPAPAKAAGKGAAGGRNAAAAKQQAKPEVSSSTSSEDAKPLVLNLLKGHALPDAAMAAAAAALAAGAQPAC
jgi:hypothetical protein